MKKLFNTDVVALLGIPPGSSVKVDNADAVVTLAATEGEHWHLFELRAGYSAAPAATKELTVVYTPEGTSTERTEIYPILIGGLTIDTSFLPPIVGAKNTRMVITLPSHAGGAGNYGYLNARYA